MKASAAVCKSVGSGCWMLRPRNFSVPQRPSTAWNALDLCRISLYCSLELESSSWSCVPSRKLALRGTEGTDRKVEPSIENLACAPLASAVSRLTWRNRSSRFNRCTFKSAPLPVHVQPAGTEPSATFQMLLNAAAELANPLV